MKLAEIINSDHIFAELSPGEASLILDSLRSANKIIELNDRTDLAKLDSFYCVRRNGEPLGWLELAPAVSVSGKKYQPIKFIYVIPSERKSRVVGLFLLGLKKVLPHPLILGSDSYGGVLFAGGVELVRALGDSRSFTVAVLDLRTGKTEPLDSDEQLKSHKHKTLVFEEDDFPLYHDAGAAGKIYLFQD